MRINGWCVEAGAKSGAVRKKRRPPEQCYTPANEVVDVTWRADGAMLAGVRSLLLAEVNDEERLYLGTMNGVYVYRP